jgi:hypothetical protein
MNVASDNALPRMRNHLQCHKSRSRRWRQHTPVAHHVSQIARGRTETRVHVPDGGNPDPAVFPGPQHRDLAELRRLSWSWPTCRTTTCGTAALVLRRVPQAAAVASKPQPAAYRVRVRGQALIAACHEGAWWQLDDWHPRSDPRIPLINRDPVANYAAHPARSPNPYRCFFGDYYRDLSRPGLVVVSAAAHQLKRKSYLFSFSCHR